MTLVTILNTSGWNRIMSILGKVMGAKEKDFIQEHG